MSSKPANRIRRVLVTPAMAEKFLARNGHNRRVQDSTVRRYASEMRNGRWIFTGEGIRFDTNGNLIDGQHRLHAVILSGVPTEFLVIEGLDPEAFRGIDKGAKRMVAHDLHVAGEKNPNNLAAAIAHLRRFERGDLWTCTAVERFVSSGEAFETLARYPGIRASVAFAERAKNVIPQSMAGFLHFVFSRHDRAIADRFFAALGDGVELGRTDPIYHLREQLLRAKADPARTMDWRHRMALAIKAWNLCATGRGIKKLQFKSTEDYPQIIGGNGNRRTV